MQLENSIRKLGALHRAQSVDLNLAAWISFSIALLFLKAISTLVVFALGALLSDPYRERRYMYINLEIRYDTLNDKGHLLHENGNTF